MIGSGTPSVEGIALREDDAESLSSLLKLGSHYLNKAKDLARAELIYNRCISEYPTDFRAYYNLGNVYTEIGDLEKALLAYTKVIEMSPSTVETYGVVGALLIKQHRPHDAVEVCFRGLQLYPADTPCMWNINIALRQEGQIHKAIDYTWKVLNNAHLKLTLALKVGLELETGAGSASVGAGAGAGAGGGTTATKAIKGKEDVPVTRISDSIGIGIKKQQVKRRRHITFTCVKWGRKYGPEYVNCLFRAIHKYWQCHSHSDAYSGEGEDEGEFYPLSSSFDFVCYTEDSTGIDVAVKCCPFPTAQDSRVLRWRSWWLKCSLFSPSFVTTNTGDENGDVGWLKGWVVYLDLDTVITSSMDIFLWRTNIGTEIETETKAETQTLATTAITATTTTAAAACASSPTYNWQEDTFYVLCADGFINEQRSQGMNSSVMIWHNGDGNVNGDSDGAGDSSSAFAALYEFLADNYPVVNKCIYKFDHYLEMFFMRAHTLMDSDSDIYKFKYIQKEFPGKVGDFHALEPGYRQRLLLPPPRLSPSHSTITAATTLCDLQRQGVALVCFPLEPKPQAARIICEWVDNYFLLPALMPACRSIDGVSEE